MKTLSLLMAGLILSSAAQSQQVSILLVGNSYTFGRVDPVMSYNAANVDDLTRPRPDLPDPNFTDTAGTRVWEPHPWGGVAVIFKQFTVQAGLDYAVSMSARNAATLRGHFLNTANADWNLRGNIASRKWDVVILQEQSDAALPPGRGANANIPQFSAYADKIERFIHVGTAETYRERAMYSALYGSTAGCVAAGGTQAQCDNNTQRVIPANPNANPDARVFLTQTWARPDMVFPHLATVSDANYPTVSDGRPIVDTSNPAFPNGFPDTLFYPTDGGMAAMTADLRATVQAKAAANPGFAGVIPAGDAFQRALDLGIAKSRGFYDAAGVYAADLPQEGMSLWWIDYLHASKYGSYLSALVIFGTVTGVDPWSLGASEKAAADLGISPGDAVRLQHVASEQLLLSGKPLARVPCQRASPAAAGKSLAEVASRLCGAPAP
ncbi:MAG: hypothetical protein V4792_12160 [Pseudomonadota bacterium]